MRRSMRATRASRYCDHCASFVAVLEQGNVFATQFHPEKSGPVGAQILSNFVRHAGGKG
jgi:imidazoleglycerol phosphate synthase glutamine amidotransferase subunit HisH